MQGIAASVILALAATTWAASPLDQTKGTEVDCSRYLRYKICPRIFRPICGTDQQTYNSECMLCMKNQEKGLQLRKLHDNECIQCTVYSAVCTMEFIPHCGSDGQQYPNKCAFCNAVLESRGELTLASYGSCESP
ncbi:double-headed protease inhibitor, submandibular gland-like [Tamandua tetradactyla]|uniref:double-headed protease inhibitor, submandibular gland-like n=1 Tax=Tamandua tetradactyla TaxID=48850 RepID=UPI0040537E89